MRYMERRILLRASRIIVLSDYMLRKAKDIHNCPGNRIVKIPGGVDLDRYHLPVEEKAAAKEAAKLPMNKSIFLTVRN
ncbi:MAG: glycosyltransferase, partial [Candidatus Hodarchaeota archaeon]